MASEDEKEGLIAIVRPEEEAVRLKTLAEEKYISSNLKAAVKYAKRAHKLQPSLGGLVEMVTAFKIIRTAATSVFPEAPGSNSAATPDYYKILDVERFSHINSIKKQYKKLALTLHPDKNPSAASEEAFKLVGEAARILSDNIRRKEYDMKLRIAMQSEAAAAAREEAGAETFWTACSTCRLLHKFARKYLGHNLLCPNCKKSFKAMEVQNAGGEEIKNGAEGGATRVSARIKEKVLKGEKLGIFEKFGLGTKRKTSTLGEVLERSGPKMGRSVNGDDSTSKRAENAAKVKRERATRAEDSEEETTTLAQMLAKKKKKADKVKIVEGDGDDNKLKSKEKKSEKYSESEKKEKADERRLEGENEIVNLTEKKYTRRGSKRRNLETAQGTSSENDRLRAPEKDVVEIMVVEEEKEKMEKEKEEEMLCTRRKRERRRVSNYGNFIVENTESSENGRPGASGIDDLETTMAEERENEIEKEKNTREKRGRRKVLKYNNFVNLDSDSEEISLQSEIDRLRSLKKGNMEIMPVEDSDFQDFDKDRRERCFKKGQVWTVYDDKDGMPRHYALIDQIVSINPFEVVLSWLQFQPDGDEQLPSREGKQFHGSCGRFKVSGNVSVRHLNLFSHVVDCERAARQAYRVYPKKGSVWALYSDSDSVVTDKRCYSIVVCLNSYSDIYGLSVAYLEKVDGFRTVFKRREIGANAVIWFGKDDLEIFSHQIPAKKLSGEEAAGLPKDCWELDPASLTSQLLIGT